MLADIEIQLGPEEVHRRMREGGREPPGDWPREPPALHAEGGGGSRSSSYRRPDWNLQRGLSGLAPNEFICPISLTLMADPVEVVQSKISYERSEIAQWLHGHPRTDPKTNITYGTNLTLKSNTDLLNKILEWRTLPETVEALEQQQLEHMSSEEEKEVLEAAQAALEEAPAMGRAIETEEAPAASVVSQRVASTMGAPTLPPAEEVAAEEEAPADYYFPAVPVMPRPASVAVVVEAPAAAAPAPTEDYSQIANSIKADSIANRI